MQRSPSPVLSYAIFFLSGISVMLLSVLLPQMHTAISDAAIGRMLAAQFIGQLLGPFAVHRNTRLAVLLGLLLSTVMAAVLALQAVPAIPTLLLYGLGLGITMTAANLLVGKESSSDQQASRIEMLNAFWPLGAACAPFCLRLAPLAAPQRVYALVSALSLVAAIALLARRPTSTTPAAAEAAHGEERSVTHLVRLAMLAALAVGLESAISNWAPTFAARYVGTLRAAGTASTVFWVAILAGRSAASLLLTRMRWSSFAIGCTLLSLLATLAFAASSGPWTYTALFFAALGIAPIYPVIIARCLALRGKSAIFVCAGIGSAGLPWIVGTLSLHTGSLRLSMLVASCAAVLLLAALLVERRQPQRVAA